MAWAALVMSTTVGTLGVAWMSDNNPELCAGFGPGCDPVRNGIVIVAAIFALPISVLALLVGHLLISAIGGVLRHRHG